jgi:5-methylcytosine-specific restriction enzyme A
MKVQTNKYVLGQILDNQIKMLNSISKMEQQLTFMSLRDGLQIKGRNRISKVVRDSIFERDKNTCRMCGRTNKEVYMTVDHIIPLSLGGSNFPDNLQTLCCSCNGKKANKIRLTIKLGEANDD